MTHIDVSQSAWSYLRVRRYDPFPLPILLIFFYEKKIVLSYIFNGAKLGCLECYWIKPLFHFGEKLLSLKQNLVLYSYRNEA